VSSFDVSGITTEQVGKVANLAASMEGFLKINALDGAAMALLTDKGYSLGCEGDLEGTLSLLACRALSEEVPFMADLSQVNFDEDYALMWHCGVAAGSLADVNSPKRMDTYFAGGKGVTTDFVMKTGAVTMFLIDTARGKTRVFLEKGTAMPMENALRGTYAKVRFTKPVREVFANVAANGVAHHVAMAYGDFENAFRKFVGLMGYEIITTISC